jgi:hypothetical protein
MAKTKRKKLLPIPKLVKKADKVFSQYIRLRDADTYVQDEEGMSYRAGKCVTCPRVVAAEGKLTGDCGHFIKRGCKLTRFHPQNAGLQCGQCNHYRGGEEGKFAVYILDTYGRESLDELMRLREEYRRTSYKWKRDELNGIIDLYSRELAKLGTLVK